MNDKKKLLMSGAKKVKITLSVTAGPNNGVDIYWKDQTLSAFDRETVNRVIYEKLPILIRIRSDFLNTTIESNAEYTTDEYPTYVELISPAIGEETYLNIIGEY